MSDAMIARIERALRDGFLHVNEATPEACFDRDFIGAAYQKNKSSMDFSEAMKQARIEWLKRVLTP